jgi:hypothetical protein
MTPLRHSLQGTAKSSPAPPSPGGQTGQAGQPVIVGGPRGPETPDQIRERVQREIQQAIRDGRDPVINFPQNPDFSNVVPEGAVIMSVAFFVCVAATIIFAPIARAFARRMDHENAVRGGGGQLAPQLQQLQDSVDTMAMEIERISEAQRFQSKLLAERAREPERIG